MSAIQIGLGIDAGGTQTRWALARANGDVIAEGSVGGMSGLMMATSTGRDDIKAALHELARSMHQHAHPHAQPARVYAGMTGFDEDGSAIAALIGNALHIDCTQVTISNDIEIAFHDCFAPGGGYVVYAGTGSVAAFIDASGALHRAGGRGGLLDDGGSGYWIAREALRHIWRAEDETPGAWQASPMAVEIFNKIGGSDWLHTRKFVYEGSRGDIGKLALMVAAAADRDAIAHKILSDAGGELARLARAMISRFGARPIALTGRAIQLHPVIEQTFRAALAKQNVTAPMIEVKISQPHIAAARVAATQSRPLDSPSRINS
jgi:glucosamine kinase